MLREIIAKDVKARGGRGRDLLRRMVYLPALIAAAVLVSCAVAIPPTTRPNILFVMTDDMPENLLNRMLEVDGAPGVVGGDDARGFSGPGLAAWSW